MISACTKVPDQPDQPDLTKRGTTGPLSWELSPDGVLIISGKGEMPDYQIEASDHWDDTCIDCDFSTSTPWNYYDITSVVINDGVTSIGNNAFYRCKSLKSVSIPNSVTSIGSKAFSRCGSLTAFVIPSSITKIGNYAFRWCERLSSIDVDMNNPEYSSENGVLFNRTKTILIQYPSELTGDYTIPGSVTSIENWGFSDCSGLKSVIIPNSVSSIGKYAFQSSGLVSVTIGNSVSSIGDRIFDSCEKLTTITFGSSVISIDFLAFIRCNVIMSFHADDNNPVYSTVDGVLFDKTITRLIKYPIGKTGAYSIPNSVKYIDASAFEGCAGLSLVIIPNSVLSIGTSAFSECSGLKSVIIPNSVTSIEDDAFSQCYGLSALIIGDSVTSIGKGAFSGCSSLSTLTIPNSVKSIGEAVFWSCSGLSSVSIGSSLSLIGNIAFLFCSKLTSFTVDESNTSFSSENGVLFDKTKTTLLLYPSGKTDNQYNIPDLVTTIGKDAFYGSRSLNFVNIPNSVTIIGESSFCRCSGLTRITIPNSVTTIDRYAFFECKNLTEIINESTVPQWLYLATFEGVNKSTCKLFVPAGSVDAYRKANEWKDFVNII